MEKLNLLNLDNSELKNLLIVTSKDQIFRDVGEETVILNLKTGLYCGLNEVGTYIWSQIKEPKTIQDILDMVLKEYDVDPEQCKHDLLKLLQQLSDNNLIEITNAKNN
ncbi:MAG: PqqD family peptide modification chaperone [Candidatus Woesearchaeota archaeon]